MERNDNRIMPHDAVNIIGDVLHDPEVKSQKSAMIKLANDYYQAEFAGKREKQEFCIFIGTLLAILCDNLARATLEPSDGKAN